MMGLTKQQSECLRFIETYHQTHSSPPTYREIMAHMGFTSLSNVCRLINALSARGAITMIPAKARSIRVVRRGEPVPARMAYLTNPSAGVTMLNVQADGDFHRFGITANQLRNLLADGANLLTKENANV